MQTGVGTFISYSTQPGNVALDGTERNSPFTAALSKSVKEPGRNLTAVMIDVRRQVLAATNGKQVPWDHSALTGDFYFHLASAPGSLPKMTPDMPGSDSEALQNRLRQVEEELRRKSDPQQTAKLVDLAQLKERVRQIEEANRADQQRIFETQRKYPASEPGARASISREIGAIQVQMVRRSEDRKKIVARIAELEAEVGLAQGGTAK